MSRKYGETIDTDVLPDVPDIPYQAPVVVENPKKIKNNEIKKKAVRRTFDLNRGCWIETEV